MAAWDLICVRPTEPHTQTDRRWRVVIASSFFLNWFFGTCCILLSPVFFPCFDSIRDHQSTLAALPRLSSFASSLLLLLLLLR
jgi:hypothetical protein